MRENNIVSGLIYGCLFPLIGFFLWRLIFMLFSENSNPVYFGFETIWDFRTAVLLAISMNLIPVQVFKKRRFYETMRGVLIVVGVLSITWFLYFKDSLLVY